MSVPNSLGSDPENVAPSETESQPTVPRPFLHEAGRSVLPAVGGIVEGNGLPCDTFGIPNALDNSPEGRASDVKRRKPRVVWDNDAKKALVLQVRIIRNPNTELVHSSADACCLDSQQYSEWTLYESNHSPLCLVFTRVVERERERATLTFVGSGKTR